MRTTFCHRYGSFFESVILSYVITDVFEAFSKQLRGTLSTAF